MYFYFTKLFFVLIEKSFSISTKKIFDDLCINTNLFSENLIKLFRSTSGFMSFRAILG